MLHPGQMGAAVAAAAARGTEVRWCPQGRAAPTVRRAADAGLTPVADLGELLSGCAAVLSICPPEAAEDVAAAVAAAAPAAGFTGLFVEANAVSPQRVRRIAEHLAAVGVGTVDGAIIGPPPTGGATARLHLAGAAADVAAVAALFPDGPVRPVGPHGGLGAASALKMAFAGYQKASRTLAAVAHALAEEHGVLDELVAEARRMPAAALADVEYTPGVAARAWRWGPELGEVAATLAAAGLPAELAEATAAVLDRWSGDRDAWDLTPAEARARLRTGG